MQYASGDVSKMMTYSPTINGTELQSCVSNVSPNGFTIKKNIAAKVCSFYFVGGWWMPTYIFPADKGCN